MEEHRMYRTRISAGTVVCALIATALGGCAEFRPAGHSLQPQSPDASATSAALVELLGGAVSEPALQAYVSGLGRRLDPAGNPARPGREFVLVRSGRLNAFAAPDGRVLLCAGLLEALPRERALAAVLAHEIAHVRASHVSALVAPQSQPLSPAHRQALGLIRHRFTPAQEHQADAIALKLLARAGIDPRGLAEALIVLQQHRPASSTSGDPRTRTHPLTMDRIRRIHRLTAALDPVRLAEPPERARRRFHAMQRRLTLWRQSTDALSRRTGARIRSRGAD
jgi:predicted Zn-dependent protease